MHKVKRFNYWQFISNNIPGFVTGIIVGVVFIVIRIGNDVSMLKERTRHSDVAWQAQDYPNKASLKNSLDIEDINENIKDFKVNIKDLSKSIHTIQDVLGIDHGVVRSATERSVDTGIVDFSSQLYDKRGGTYMEEGLFWSVQHITWFGEYLRGERPCWVDLEMQESVMTYKEYLAYLNNG